MQKKIQKNFKTGLILSFRLNAAAAAICRNACSLIFTSFLIVGNGIWTAGQTLNFRLFTIGESTFAMNIAYSDAASVGNPSRFGRAVSKIQFTEIST